MNNVTRSATPPQESEPSWAAPLRALRAGKVRAGLPPRDRSDLDFSGSDVYAVTTEMDSVASYFEVGGAYDGESDDSNEIESWDRGEFQLKVGSLEPESPGAISPVDLGINPTMIYRQRPVEPAPPVVPWRPVNPHPTPPQPRGRHELE